MKIGIVSEWFDPEPGPASLPGELARELAARGHDVKVLTTFPNYPSGKVYPGYRNQRRYIEQLDGMSVCRVALYPSHDSSAVKRVATYISFGASILANSSGFLDDRDAVWISNSPPTVALYVKHLHKKGIRTVVHVLDVWPDNILSSGLVGSAPARIMSAGVGAMNRQMFAAADRVLTIAPSMGELLTARGVDDKKIDYSPLWANETRMEPVASAAANDLRDSLDVAEGTVVVLYAGAVGHVQGLDQLVKGLGSLDEDVASGIECWIIGDGTAISEVSSAVAHLPSTAPRIRLFGRKDMSEMALWTSACDVSYVGLTADQHAAHSFPSKVQATLFMGKPLLASVAGDVNALVESEGIGVVAEPGDVDSLTRALTAVADLGRAGLGEMGTRARTLYASTFSRAVGVSRVERSLLERSPTSEIAIRLAGPDDVDEVVRVHMRSFPTFFLTFLGPRFLRLLYADIVNDRNAELIVADDGVSIVGLLAGLDDEPAYFAGLRSRSQTRFIAASVGALVRRPSIAGRLIRARRREEQHQSDDRPTLLSFAVDPRVQGQGVGGRLLDAYEAQLRQRHFTGYKLTTDAEDNEATQRFYESHGLVRESEWATPEGRKMLTLGKAL